MVEGLLSQKSSKKQDIIQEIIQEGSFKKDYDEILELPTSIMIKYIIHRCSTLVMFFDIDSQHLIPLILRYTKKSYVNIFI